MKRDLRIHFEVLEELAWDLNRFKEAIQAMQEAVRDLDALLAAGEGQAFEALRAGKTRIEGHLQHYYEQVDDIYQLVAGYNNDMKSYIRPIRHDTMVRVDRDDIWFNLNSMQTSINSLSTIRTSVPRSRTSDILKQYERKHNINQVHEIEAAISHLQGSLDEYLEAMKHLYGTRIVPFENTDDEYKRKTKEIYYKYTSSAERRSDIWNGVVSGTQDFGIGFFDSFKNLAKGIFSTFEFLAGGVVVVVSNVIGTPKPDWAEESVSQTLGTFLIALKDPLLIAESMAQGVSDTYEEEGIVYMTGYVTGELTQVYLAKKAAEKLRGKGTEKDLPELDVEDVPKRPTWRESEVDAGKEYSGYDSQKSFLNGEEVPYATKGSTRPEYYTPGHSIEVKNYNIETKSGQNNLVNNVSNQVENRVLNLPSGTKQTVIIDVRGQQVTNEMLKNIRDRILEKTGIELEIIFKKGN